MQSKNVKPKFKHNKKRNTAFLFESLVKELTKQIMYDNKQKQKAISVLIHEHFNKNNILNRELNIYKQIYETKEFPREITEKLLNTLKSEHEKLNDKDIYNEQSKLIAKINKTLGPQVFDNYVPNYKTLATISQVFNKSVEIKQKILLEQDLINTLTSKVILENKEIKNVDNSVMHRFIDRFNEAYKETLLQEQKQLLSFYINSAQDDIELKLFINEEIKRLTEALGVFVDKDETGNCKKVCESLKNLKFEDINDDLIKKVMYAQQFIHEVQN